MTEEPQRFLARIPREDYEALNAASEVSGVSINTLVVDAIRHHLKNHDMYSYTKALLNAQALNDATAAYQTHSQSISALASTTTRGNRRTPSLRIPIPNTTDDQLTEAEELLAGKPTTEKEPTENE